MTPTPHKLTSRTVLIGLLCVVALVQGLIFTSTNVSLLWSGLWHGAWFVERLDFKLAIVVQLLASVTTIIVSTAWLYATWVSRDRPAPWSQQTRTRLALAALVGFVVITGAHRWYAQILCESRSDMQGECYLLPGWRP